MSEYDQGAALNQGLPNLPLTKLFGQACWTELTSTTWIIINKIVFHHPGCPSKSMWLPWTRAYQTCP